jgi:predicted nuclease of restriction endonuclease-like (RecB) superfamily
MNKNESDSINKVGIFREIEKSKMSKTENITSFVGTLKSAIQLSQFKAAKVVNTHLVQLYFVLGAALSHKTQQAKWGDNVLENISKELQKEMKGLRGFSAQNLKKMRLFYDAYPMQLDHCDLWQDIAQNKKINFGSTLSNENRETKGSTLPNELDKAFWNISFSNHFSIISKISEQNIRHFYIHQTNQEGWSNRILENHLKNKIHLQNQIPSNFTTTISSPSPEKAITQFKDEYLLDFINIDDSDNERIIEDKIVQNIKDFILHMGKGFSFIGNQYRLEVEQDEFFIDLLFYNRQLQCLVAIELKRGKFKPEHIGQLSFYLSVLDAQVKLPHENPSIGIVLCKEKNNSVVEFALQNSRQPMGVATFKTKQELPSHLKNYLPSVAELKKLLKTE